MPIAGRGSRWPVSTMAEQGAADAHPDGHRHGHRQRLGPHARRPRVVIDRVDPERFQPQPDGADAEAGHRAEHDGALDQWRQREQLDHYRGAEVQREPTDRCAQYRADDERDRAAQCDGQQRAAMSAAPRPSTSRAATSAIAAAPAIIIGSAPAGTARPRSRYSIWNTDSPMNSPPNDRYCSELDERCVRRRVGPHRPLALVLEQQHARSATGRRRRSASDALGPTA